MSGKLARIAIFSAALAAFGMTGAVTSTASAAPAAPTAMHFITHYSSESQCHGGGSYYVRHGYSSYYCLRESAGWGLYVWD
ncbi:hypothetical protein [Streptomyces venezuelae]|uniref:Uncharacterized protein n=1 Tax=Streptomyces venezuelae TaxID=54571 RepID=A0A5P2ATX7_STRVZ|nr:hypothetical protein [Streptomyces venezuelae]QES21247.1 hypothetical protein DEJ46_20830 [Streptomyces venezuelae]